MLYMLKPRKIVQLFLFGLFTVLAGTVQSQDSIEYLGLDVSHFQGDIDWRKVKESGITFAIMKASEGLTEVDPKFTTNWSGALSAGLVRGAYHFFRPEDDALAQAQHYIKTVQLQAGDLVPVIDIEVIDSASILAIDAGVKRWLQYVEQATGVKPMIYSDLSFLNSDLESGFGEYPLWIAEYTSKEPQVPAAWRKWQIWQYSQSGTVPGIDGAVDLDRFRGVQSDWDRIRVSK